MTLQHLRHGIDAVQLRHRYIHDGNVGLIFIDHSNRLTTVRSQPHHHHVRLITQHGTQALANNGMIICDENTDVQKELSISKMTRVPSLGSDSISTLPPMDSMRSRMIFNPQDGASF